MLAAMLNGQSIACDQPAIHINDRGLLYGDGVFETMLLRDGIVRFLDDHLQRACDGCHRLKIAAPDVVLLHAELQQLMNAHRDGVIKLVVTRGRGGRGYRPANGVDTTRLWQLFAPSTLLDTGITIRMCETRLTRNPLLAGIKHLNRLEQVLAQSEWDGTQIGEGLMLDTDGDLISGTMSNVFIVIKDVIVTPGLDYCGVRGVMRKNVLRLARDMGIATEERIINPVELYAATEVFVTNAVRGIQPVMALVPASGDIRHWPVGSVVIQLMQRLSTES